MKPFHTEFFCDVLALYVKGEPASGGDMKIAPSWQVYNDLRESRPDVIQTLLKPNWKFERSVAEHEIIGNVRTGLRC